MKLDLLNPKTGVNDNCTLYAFDIMQNQKSNDFYTFAHLGEALIIAYKTKATMYAFAKCLCRVFKDGADMQYQPTMRTKIEGNVLAISCNRNQIGVSLINTFIENEAPTNETIYNFHSAQVFDMMRTILSNNPDVRVIVVVGLAEYLPDFDLYKIQKELNTIAHDTGTLILWGYCLQDADTLNDRNVCYLLEDVYKGTPFFWFVYGYPDAKRMIYSINEEGKVIIPQIDEGSSSPVSLKKLVIMEYLCKRFAKKMVRYDTLSHLLEGAFGNEYTTKTTHALIALAVDHGILQQSGEGKKATLIYAESRSNRKTYKDNIGIVAPSYIKPYKKGNPKDCAFIKFGQTKLVHGEIADKITLAIMKAIISGKNSSRDLYFKLKTTHKNILVALIADEKQVQAYKEQLTAYAKSQNFAANIDVVGIAAGMTKAQFLIKFKDLYGKFLPDFYFVQNLQNVQLNIDHETPVPYVKELADYAKSKSFALIVHADEDDWGWIDICEYPEQIGNETLCFLDNKLDDKLYDFKTKCGKRYAFMRFEITADGEIRKPYSWHEKEAYLDRSIAESCEYRCTGCAREDLRDVYDEPINESQLKEAIRLKIAYKHEGRIYYRPKHKR